MASKKRQSTSNVRQGISGAKRKSYFDVPDSVDDTQNMDDFEDSQGSVGTVVDEVLSKNAKKSSRKSLEDLDLDYLKHLSDSDGES